MTDEKFSYIPSNFHMTTSIVLMSCSGVSYKRISWSQSNFSILVTVFFMFSV